jgi:hypothetical protein
MLATWQARLMGAGAIILLVLGAYAWAHHRGAVSQQTVDAAVIAQKDRALDAAGASLANAASALRAASAATLANRDAAVAAQAKASAAKRDADEAKLALAAADIAWQARFKAAQATKGCETLKEELCPSVMPY